MLMGSVMNKTCYNHMHGLNLKMIALLEQVNLYDLNVLKWLL